MKVMDDNFMVCGDCLQAIVNDDYTGLDYHYTAEEVEQRIKAIQDGIKAVKGHIVCGDEEPETFSIRPCECCGCGLAGERYQCVVFER